MAKRILPILAFLVGILLAAGTVAYAEESSSAAAGTSGSGQAEAATAEKVRPWNSVDEPWRLIPRIDPLRLDVYGWVEAGYTAIKEAPSSRYNGVVVFNDRHRDIVLDQLYLVIERPLERPEDRSKLYLDIGGRIDTLFGQDARFTEPIHYGGKWNAGRDHSGVDFPQAYLQAGVAKGPMNLTLTGGRFYWPGAYESPMAPENFFYSHSYSMAYGQPITVTGAAAKLGVDLPLGSDVAVLAGLHRGWNNIDRHPLGNDTGSLYGLQLHSDWETTGWDTALSLTYSHSDETANPFIPGIKDDARLRTVVLEQQIWNRLTYAFEYASGEQDTGSPFHGGPATWRARTHYLVLKLHRAWSVGVRHETFDDLDGSRVGGIGGRQSGSPIVPFGFKGEFHDIAYGVDWKPTANLTVRGEVRHDSFDGVSGFGPRPFDDGASDHQTLYAINVILRF